MHCPRPGACRAKAGSDRDCEDREACARPSPIATSHPLETAGKTEAEPAPGPRVRIAWIDALRGVGILIVVAGHVFTWPPLRHAIFLFHMPLFFFLSGLTFRPGPLRALAARRVMTLVLPYASFVLLAFAIYVAATSPSGPAAWRFAATLAYGGSALGGALAIAWFVPCLFWTSLAYAAAAWRFGNPLRPAMIAFAALALALAYLLPPMTTPLGVGQVPFAFACFWLGAAWRQIEPPGGAWMPGLLCFAAGILWAPPLDMRLMAFGWPIVSLVVALGGIAVLLRAAQVVARSRATAILSSFGRAALPILFLHMGFMVLFGSQLPEPATYAVALIGPYLAWLPMTRFRATRVLFLGQGEPPAWLAGHR